MKKILSILVSVAVFASAFVGCASGSSVAGSSSTTVASANAVNNSEKLNIVATIFPAYDWTRAVLGDTIENVELTMLLDDGVDLHSFQPTADDMITIADCDLFIYVGGESDGWVEDALKNATNPDMQVINLMETLGDSVKIEQMVEGMQETAHDHDGDGVPDHDVDDCEEDAHDHDHEEDAHDHEEDDHDHDHDHDEDDDDHDHEEDDHDHDHEEDDHDHDHEEDAHDHDHEEDDHDHDHEEDDHDHDHEHGIENDEHVWLSLEMAEDVCAVIADALAKLNPEQAQTYAANYTAYKAQLNTLDQQYEAMVETATHHTIVMPDRFPFRYLVDDYDIDYYAAFVGCSAETEASFETIAFLANKLDELGVAHVLVTESSDYKIANTVIQNSTAKNQQILVLNSMQAVTSKDVAAGTTYLSIMEDNLQALTVAMQ